MIMVKTKRVISINSPWWGRQHLITTKVALIRVIIRQVQLNLCNWTIMRLHSSIKRGKMPRIIRHRRKCLVELGKDAWCNSGAILTSNITTMTRIVAISEVSTRSKTNTENRGEKVATITPLSQIWRITAFSHLEQTSNPSPTLITSTPIPPIQAALQMDK